MLIDDLRCSVTQFMHASTMSLGFRGSVHHRRREANDRREQKVLCEDRDDSGPRGSIGPN
jgi:hypothetical protein